MKRLLLLLCLGFMLSAFLCSCSCEEESPLVPPQMVTVKFESYIGVPIESRTVAVGSRIPAPAVELERDGYVMRGWYNGTKLWSFDKDAVTENMTLTARWMRYLSYVAVSEIESPTVGALFGDGLSDGVAVAGCDTLYITSVQIPRAHNGKAVVGILPFAFADNKSIKTVVIPETVTVIGENAFSGCVNLEKICFEADSLPNGWSQDDVPDGVEIVLGYKK